MSLSEVPGARAEFHERVPCIACASDELETLDTGRFDEEPHAREFANSPWGESPSPYLAGSAWELVRCRRCALVYHKRVLNDAWEDVRFSRWMTKEAIREFEDRAGTRTPAALLDRSKWEVGWVLTVEKLTRELRGDAAVRWLDFGCGFARMVQLARLFGFEAHGIDKHAARREVAEAEVTVHESIEDLRREQAEPFHVVSLYEVLEHLHDPGSVLGALRELLVPGGYLIVEVPDGTGFDNLTRGGRFDLADGLDHINVFDPTTLARFVESRGFARVVRRPTPQVTADFASVLRREARRVLERLRGTKTSQLFRRT